MYKPGLLTLTTPPCGKGWRCEHTHEASDGRDWDNEPLPLGTAFLPHSCNEWVIGGPKEMKELIADLQAALRALEGE